jgi:carboxylesterase type B
MVDTVACDETEAGMYSAIPGLEWQRCSEEYKNIFNYGEAMSEESEDCLYLNIYTPRKGPKKEDLKPVMLWIFGGNLQFGTASLERYNGGTLAYNNNVVVVTFNYRLNIFGF